MNKPNVKIDALKKITAKFIKQAPKQGPTPEPLARLVLAFLEYDCDAVRAEAAAKKFQDNMVDYNELRVTPAIELAALLGVRFPFAESRCSQLHRTLQSIFDREHHMALTRLTEMKKQEIRPYLQSLAGISPYVEAAICVDCFGVAAVPMDTKLLLWLISKEVFGPEMDIRTAQQVLEKNIKSSEAVDFFHGARKELDDWSPKSWPLVAKVPSPILAPPPYGAAAEAAAAAAAVEAAKVKKTENKPEPITIKTKTPPPAPAKKR